MLKITLIMLAALASCALEAPPQEVESSAVGVEVGDVVDEVMATGSEALVHFDLETESDVFVASSSEDPDQGLIRCELTVDHPHMSHHTPCLVNVVARTKCTSPVDALQMHVNLVRDGITVANGLKNNSGQKFLKVSAAGDCLDGVYQGTAQATIHFPPGHEPSPQILYETGLSIPIECGIPAAVP